MSSQDYSSILLILLLLLIVVYYNCKNKQKTSVITGYNCVNNTCAPVYDNAQATYKTEAECKAACKAPTPPPPPPPPPPEPLLMPTDIPKRLHLRNANSQNYFGGLTPLETIKTVDNYFESSGTSNAYLKSFQDYSNANKKYLAQDGSLVGTNNFKFSLYKDKAGNKYIKESDTSDLCLNAAGAYEKCDLNNINQRWLVDETPPDLYPASVFSPSPKRFNFPGTNKCLNTTGTFGDCTLPNSLLDYKIIDENDNKNNIQIYANPEKTQCIIGDVGTGIKIDSCDPMKYWSYHKRPKNDEGLLIYADTKMAINRDGKLVPWYEVASGGDDYKVIDPFTVYPMLKQSIDALSNYSAFGYVVVFTVDNFYLNEEYLKSLIGLTIKDAIASISAKIKGKYSNFFEKNNNFSPSEIVAGVSQQVSRNGAPPVTDFTYRILLIPESKMTDSEIFCNSLNGIEVNYSSNYTDLCNNKYSILYEPSRSILVKDTEMDLSGLSIEECNAQLGRTYQDIFSDNNLSPKISYPTTNANDKTVRERLSKSPLTLDFLDFRVIGSGVPNCKFRTLDKSVVSSGTKDTNCVVLPEEMFIHSSPINFNNKCNKLLTQFRRMV